MDQAVKPSSEWSNILNLMSIKGWIDFGNVDLGGTLDDLWPWVDGENKPGFADTEYDIEAPLLTDEWQIIRKYTGSVSHADVPLTYALNKYEMFAFGASSIVAAVGGVDDMSGLGGVFDLDKSANLNQIFGASSKFNNLNTGHSAQFVHSYSDVAGYWQKLKEDIE